MLPSISPLVVQEMPLCVPNEMSFGEAGVQSGACRAGGATKKRRLRFRNEQDS